MSSTEQNAELTFKVSDIKMRLKEEGYAERVTKKGAAFLAGVLEYVAAELLELSGEEAKKDGKVR
jgi:histone H2A